MQKIWTKALKDSISEVFNTMFFLVPVGEPGLAGEVAEQPAEGWYEGSLAVKRDDDLVTFHIWAQSGLARALAANILSSEPEDLSLADVLDAYKEMLNMVAGNVLTAVDADGQWRMGLPGSTRLGEGVMGQRLGQAGDALYFDVEGRTLVAALAWQ